MNGYHAPIQYKHNRKKRRYGKKKLRINFTVLFVVLFIIGCFVGAVFLGNYLKDKVGEPHSGPASLPETNGEKPDGSHPSVSDAAQKRKSHRSGCFFPYAGADAYKLAGKLFDSGYDSVTIPLKDDTGALLYYSASAVALSRLPEDAQLPSLGDTISAIRAAGRVRGIEPLITVYYDMAYHTQTDPVIGEAALLYETAVISEAYSLGADGVLLTGLPTEGGRITDPDGILAVIDKLRASSPDIALTLAFPYEVYADRAMSQTLDTLVLAAGALAVDTTPLDWSYSETEEEFTYTNDQGEPETGTETVRQSSIYSSLDSAAAAIKSSTALYSLGFVIRGNVPYNEVEAVDALYHNGTYAYFVISAPEEMSQPTTPGETSAEETSTKPTPDTTSKPKP